MTEPQDSCVQAAKGPIGLSDEEASSASQMRTEERRTKMVARVGKPAPDFEASAFVDGGFKNVKLSDYKGHWVALCFYPGAFTFV